MLILLTHVRITVNPIPVSDVAFNKEKCSKPIKNQSKNKEKFIRQLTKTINNLLYKYPVRKS